MLQSRKFKGVPCFTLMEQAEIEKGERTERLRKQQKSHTNVKDRCARERAATLVGGRRVSDQGLPALL